MSVLARFRVVEKSEVEHYEKGSAFRIKLAGSKDPVFGEATPQAHCEMLIVPHDAAGGFRVGRFYRVTFEEDADQEPHS